MGEVVRSVSTWAILVSTASIALVACNLRDGGGGQRTDDPAVTAARQSAIIFDDDGRVDVSQIASMPLTAAQQANVRTVVAATAILVDQSAVSCPTSGACTLTIGAPTFNGLPLCSDQKFAGQQGMTPPQAMADGRNCDAFLVAPNLMLTNGACFSQSEPGLPFNCRTSRVVFGFELAAAGAGTPVMVPRENVYDCKAILDKQFFSPVDASFAAFTLDRNVTGRTPLAFRQRTEAKMADDVSTLAVAGHPLGLPMKISAGVTVFGNSDPRVFRPTTDIDTGESGAPVFDTATGKVEGITTSLIPPRFDVRPGGAPGGGDCLMWRVCTSGTCEPAANANFATRTSFADDNLVHFKAFFPPGFPASFPVPGPGTNYVVLNGERLITTSTGGSVLPDSDGDTLPDQWETAGVTFQIGGQAVFLDLPAMGADPLHHDLFVQMDWMERTGTNPVSFQLPPSAQDAMRQSFQNAPVWNPDGEPGVRLHLDAGAGSKTWDRTLRTWVDWPSAPTAACGAGCVRRATTVPYSKYFVTSSTCNASGCSTERAAAQAQTTALAGQSFVPFGRNNIFFYGISVDQLWQTVPNPVGTSPNTGGVCERTPGSTEWTYGASGTNVNIGFLVSLGVQCPVDGAAPRDRSNGCASGPASTCSAGGSLLERTQTAQHELGHMFGFQHFGSRYETGSTSAYKPNYLSVMSYLYQLATYVPLDYSRHTLRALGENSLDETVGVHDPDQRPAGWFCPALSTGTPFNTASGAGAVMPAAFPGAIDWNCSGFNVTPAQAPEAVPVAANVDGQQSTITHTGWNDWAALLYYGANVTGNGTLSDLGPEAGVEDLEATVPFGERQAFAQLPTASFKLTKSGIRAPLTVTYDASQSRDLQGAVVEYRWSFDDGQQAVTTQPTVTHVFRKPGTFVTQLTVKDAQNNLSRFAASERVQVDRAIAPDFLGFEDPARSWTSGATAVPTSGTRKTEGDVAAVIAPCGYQTLKSPAANTTDFLSVGTQLAIDVFVPATVDLSNPAWVGDVQPFAQIAAANVNNVALGGSQGLTTLPRGTFTTLTFPVSATIRQAFLGDFPDAQIVIAVNNGSCRTPLVIDNVRFTGTLTPRTVFHHEGSAGLQVATSPLFSFETTTEWSSPQVAVRAEPVLKSEGSLSLGVPVSGSVEVRSRPFTAAEITGETGHLNVDVFIPKPQPNVFWTGDLQVVFDCPSAGISNLSLGSQSLTGRFQNEFNALAFNVPGNVLGVLNGAASGCRFLVRINAATGAGTFFLDRLGFTP